jgi:hypothetical protein
MAGQKANGLTPKQEQAITALLTEPTVAKAATLAGVGERTLYTWLDEPAFSRAYRHARRQAFSHAVSLTQRYAPLAVQTLAKIMADPEAPYPSRVAAATALLKVGRESLELDDLAQRIDALEAAQEKAA